MKIAIPIVDGQLALHFGHCREFAVFTVDAEAKEIEQVERLTPPPHEPGVLPRWLHELGAGVIIAGGMGQRAIQLFQQNDIAVVVGVGLSDPQALVQSYMAGDLETGDNRCAH